MTETNPSAIPKSTVKLKLSEASVQKLKDLWMAPPINIIEVIACAIELAEVVENKPDSAPEPTPAGDTVRDFDVWWKEYVTAFPQTRGDESSAYHAWLAATTKRLSK